MSVRFNAQNEDKEYLERITKRKHGEQRKELLEYLSPVAAQRVRNNDEGWMRVLEYLMTEERDIEVPVVPQQPKRLLHLHPTDSFLNAESTDSTDITISEYRQHLPKHNTDTSNSDGSQPLDSYSQTSGKPASRVRSYLSNPSSKSAQPAGVLSSDSESRKYPSVHSAHGAIGSYIDDTHEKDASQPLQPAVEGHATPPQDTGSQAPESSRNAASRASHVSSSSQVAHGSSAAYRHSNDEETTSEGEEQTRELSQQSETIVDRVKRHFVELTDWSDYLRFKQSRSCGNWCYKCCVLTMLLLILLAVCAGIYLTIMCCFGSIAGVFVGQPISHCTNETTTQIVHQQYDDSRLLEQLAGHQQTISYLQRRIDTSVAYIAELAGHYLNTSMLTDGLRYLETKLHVLESLLQNQYVNTSKEDFQQYVSYYTELRLKYDALEKEMKQIIASQALSANGLKQLSKQIDDLQLANLDVLSRIDSIPTKMHDEIEDILANYTMLNADVRDYKHYYRPLTRARPLSRLNQITRRDYYPGDCYPTISKGYFAVQLKYPAKPRYLIVGHPYANSLSHGRDSAPRQISITLRVRTQDGEEKKRLESLEFDQNGKKEQAFDLYDYGLSEEDVILGFVVEYQGDHSTVCLYYMGLFGRYEPLYLRSLPDDAK